MSIRESEDKSFAHNGVATQNRVRYAKSNAKTFLLSRVSLTIGEGRTVKGTARFLRISRQRVEYHAKKAVRMGWLRKEGNNPALYYLTESGMQRFLNRDEREGVSDDGKLRVRSHGACLKFAVLEFPGEVGLQRLQRDSRDVPLRNWTPRYTDCGGLSVKITTRNVFVWVNSVWVDSDDFKERAVLDCMSAATEVAAIFCSKYGFKLDLLHPEFAPAPQYAVIDLFTDDGEKVRLSFEKGQGAIDYSKGFRELEYTDAKHMSDFLAMPGRVEHIEKMLEEHRSSPQVMANGQVGEPPLDKVWIAKCVTSATEGLQIHFEKCLASAFASASVASSKFEGVVSAPL